METSLYLAKLLGPLLVIFGISILLNPARIRAVGQRFLDDEALMFTSGILASGTGLALVLSHNVWSFDWRGAITLFGWIALLAGAGRLWFPTSMAALGDRMIDNPILIAVPGGLMVLLGVYLSYQGYYAAA